MNIDFYLTDTILTCPAKGLKDWTWNWLFRLVLYSYQFTVFLLYSFIDTAIKMNFGFPLCISISEVTWWNPTCHAKHTHFDFYLPFSHFCLPWAVRQPIMSSPEMFWQYIEYHLGGSQNYSWVQPSFLHLELLCWKNFRQICRPFFLRAIRNVFIPIFPRPKHSQTTSSITFKAAKLHLHSIHQGSLTQFPKVLCPSFGQNIKVPWLNFPRFSAPLLVKTSGSLTQFPKVLCPTFPMWSILPNMSTPSLTG